MRLVLLPMDLPQQQQQHYWPRMDFTTVPDIINMGCNSKPCKMATTTTTTTTAAISSQTHQHLAHSLLTCRWFSWTFSLVLCSQPLPTVFSISKFFSTHAATVVAGSFAYFSSSAVSPSSSSYRCDYCCWLLLCTFFFIVQQFFSISKLLLQMQLLLLTLCTFFLFFNSIILLLQGLSYR